MYISQIIYSKKRYSIAASQPFADAAVLVPKTAKTTIPPPEVNQEDWDIPKDINIDDYWIYPYPEDQSFIIGSKVAFILGKEHDLQPLFNYYRDIVIEE